MKVSSGARSDHSGRLWLTLSGRLGPIHACICPCGGGAHGVASDSRFACRGRGNGAASTLGTRARSDLRCAVGSLAPRRGHPRLACDVAAHLLHQRRGGHASLPACSGVRARMLTAGGPAHCASLASARLLHLPTAVRECSWPNLPSLPASSCPPALSPAPLLLLPPSPAPLVGPQVAASSDEPHGGARCGRT